MLNNRELSLLIWLLIFLLWSLVHPNLRQSTAKVVKSFFVSSILATIGVLVLYTLAEIWLLYKINVWNQSLIKDTVLWFFAVPFLTMLNINENASDPNYFKKAWKNLLAFSTIAEFLLNFYSGSLFVELLLVPFISLCTLTLLVSKTKKGYEKVQRFLQQVLSLIGVLLIIFTVFQLAQHFGEFASWSTLQTFLLSPLLTLLFLPFAFVLFYYTDVERVLVMLKVSIKDKQLLRAARIQGLCRFLLDRKGLQRWSSSIGRNTPASREELLGSIKLIKELQAAERNPQPILKENGWSPYSAKEFLVEKKLPTGNYDHCYEDEYMACSKYHLLNEHELIPDNISYYVEGKKQVALSLSLSLNINISHPAERKHLILVEYAQALYAKAVGGQLPIDMEKAISNASNYQSFSTPFLFSVKRNNFQNRTNGFSLAFTIAVDNNYLHQ